MVSVGFALRNFSLLSGVSRYVAELAQRLPARGFEASIVANRMPVTERSDLRVDHVSMFSLTSRFRAASFDWAARRRLGRHSVQLVHGNGDLTVQDVLSVHNCDDAAAYYIPDGRRPSPGVQYIRGHQFRPGNAKVILANSDMVRRDMAEFYKVPPERVRRVYLGVDLERFRPGLRANARPALLRETGWPEEAKVVLAVLSGDPAKRNFSLLAESIEVLSRSEPVYLCAVGRSQWANVSAARRLQALGRFHSVETTPRVEMYYAAADVFGLPAFYEEFGMPVLEALASGCPVVVSSRCGAAEIMEEGNGYVVDQTTDRDEWVEKIGLALSMNLQNESCRKTAELFSWDRHTDEISSIYKELL